MPSSDRKLELKAKTSVAQTASQTAVYAEGLTVSFWKERETFEKIVENLIFKMSG
jgi:hypothetical protein